MSRCTNPATLAPVMAFARATAGPAMTGERMESGVVITTLWLLRYTRSLESGTHEELFAVAGTYAELFTLQASRANSDAAMHPGHAARQLLGTGEPTAQLGLDLVARLSTTIARMATASEGVRSGNTGYVPEGDCLGASSSRGAGNSRSRWYRMMASASSTLPWPARTLEPSPADMASRLIASACASRWAGI